MWNNITSSEQLKEAIRSSHDGRIAIFKHSTRCGISSFVLKNLEKYLKKNGTSGVQLYFLDLLSQRDLSNAIASDLEVQHESPQLIILEKGNVVHHASHHQINGELLTAEYAV